MIRLLLSLLRPQSGEITVYCDSPASGASGPASAPASPSTRCNLVYVPQGNSLFSGSVRDNLLMGNPDATEQQLRDALHIAAADFVFDLQGGLDAQCFESGRGLSEGQAQRIAIARALIKAPEIIMADEPTGALDSETSVQIMDLLKEVAKDRLVVMVTHNPELAETYATRTIRMLDGSKVGEIRESGSECLHCGFSLVKFDLPEEKR